MDDESGNGDALRAILGVLQSIEKKLNVHERQLNALQVVPASSHAQDAIPKPGIASDSDLPGPQVQEDRDWSDVQRAPVASQEDDHDSPIIKVPYTDIGFSAQELASHASLKFQTHLGTQLGDCARLPDDRRLPLQLFNRPQDWMNNTWAPHYTAPFNLAAATRKAVDHLVQFDRELRSSPGNDFLIIDYDAAYHSRLYRIGEPAIGSEIKVDLKDSSHKQWSRLILYQGMTTGNSIKPHKARQATLEPIPYFSSFSAPRGLWSHIHSHMNPKYKASVTNPYVDPVAGFTTRFYEIRKEATINGGELWDHGQLYDHPLGWSFRKSAFTLYNPVPTSSGHDSSSSGFSRHWTLLLLCPDAFFNENNLSFPLKDKTPSKVDTSRQPFGGFHSLGAEINLIGQGLGRISERWAEFQSFFDYILDNGRSLFNPSEHDSFLFDNSSFDRSRRYFWAIDCLSEFEQTIADTLHQWDMYREVRVDPVLLTEAAAAAAGGGVRQQHQYLPALDRQQLSHVEKQYRILSSQRTYFLDKLAATRALRDALFSASAVIESRASTRLGENLKLLTFVNIFFLPLSFCTSLWSISRPYSTPAFGATIVLVALATYLIMFNIGSVSALLRAGYERQKRALVFAMTRDPRVRWQDMGRRFGVFRPRMGQEADGSVQPSEWWVLVYGLMNVGQVWRGRSSRGRKGKTKNGEGERGEGDPVGFREDEGWVL